MSEKLPLQGQCAGCPKLEGLKEKYDQAEMDASFITDVALRDIDADKAAKKIARQYNLAPDDARQKVKEAILAARQSLARGLDDIDEVKAAIKAEVAALSLPDCPGPIKMRGVKAGRVIMATICSSPAEQISGIELVRVQRS